MCRKTTNRERAEQEADRIEGIIIQTLQAGKNFRVEAGAGSGKTYSLINVIDWIQKNKWAYYQKRRQNVICITYTNAAVEVISKRLKDESFIIPSTIHSFAWNAIKQYQSFLLSIVKKNESYYPQEGKIEDVKEVQYALGHRYIENDILYLYHDDVIALFSELLDNKKFRTIFTSKYPLILIDEYQDSFKRIIDKFLLYFIIPNYGCQFGFFGDSWQTIYQSQDACGLIEHENIVEIKKGVNFRSAPAIVNMLNKIRYDLPQISAIDDMDGEAIVVTCNDYKGERRTDRYFKGDLPIEILRGRINNLNDIFKKQLQECETNKTLMITHKVLATQQGYEILLDELGDKLKDKEDPVLLFFMNTVEPIYNALLNSDMVLLFETLGVKQYPITKRAQKRQWQQFMIDMTECRSKAAYDVLKMTVQSGLVPIPNEIENVLLNYANKPNELYKKRTIKEFLEIPYNQFLSAINFLYPESEFSTEHGVKGEEYDNVIFSITRGWTHYQFEKYMPMIFDQIPEDQMASFIRNRNLFYVCCSRPRKRLIIFVSIYVDTKFENFLKYLVGEKNYYTYSDFIKKK
ncbi:MAG: AAA family ATPase [Eubacterium sp.]|nr:AAA family ATPase [Eubacterium sp.]